MKAVIMEQLNKLETDTAQMRRATMQTNEEIVQMVDELAHGQIPPLRDARRAVVRWALSHSSGNVSQAAQELGISRGTIYRYARP